MGIEGSDQHEALADHTASLAATALQRFFHARPTAGSKLCIPRMFKSSRLAELAPGVFLPEYPQIIKSRQHLIPALAKILTSFKRQNCENVETVQRFDDEHARSNDAEWYEEKLWSSMMNALKMPARARLVGSASKASDGTDYGICSTAHDAVSLCANGEQSARARMSDWELASYDESELDWLPPCKQEEAVDEDMLDLNSGEHSDDDSFLLDASASDEESLFYRSQGVSAEISSRAHRDLANQSEMGTVSRPGRAKPFRGAEQPRGVLTHIDEKDNNTTQALEYCENCSGIGQSLLTHGAGSTLLHEDTKMPDMDDDILIPQDRLSSILCSSSELVSAHCKHRDSDFCPEGDRCSILPEIGEDQFDSDNLDHTLEMPSHSPRQSLSEALGGDRLLWNIWKRRGSAALPEAGDMLELHNMLENDPDMRLLSSKREDQPPQGDSMLFDSYDYSRRPPLSSDSSYTGSSSNELFEEPLEDPVMYSQFTQSSTQAPTSTPTTKKAKRRPSLLQKITRPSRMSEDDILFQQSSPTRQVDIKKRKTLLEYHRGQ
ncbi:hypothetical protein PMZ80_002170 [Knufia obscura]|uniref:Uncharacterized protein n=2 Tax=Knufia TaxID=430999 RepID=A0AAN8F9L9_9EURO|nr:hypothetical protein PMZ80_002170 [Knufia obscura]KAK5953981.1 hypothetical protein OHC33_005253 [Knufia fluminis]